MATPRKIKANVKNIEAYGDSVYRLTLNLEQKFPRFKAGQFLHLTVDDFDPTTGFWPESRVFSITTCSDDRRTITIIYSVKGKYTKKMENLLQIGSSVWIKGPYGDFVISNHVDEGNTAVLIAGGTGISPFIQFILQKDFASNIVLNYGVKDVSRMIFDQELVQASKKNNCSVNIFIEDESEVLSIDGDISSHSGLLSIPKAFESLDNIEKSVFFISGPPIMISLFKTQLEESGIDKNKIIIDEWE